MPCQYGEEKIILPFFKDTSKGVVVDVGAADGIRFSNSRLLIERGWRGILIEPEPTQFKMLRELYKSNPSVQYMNYGVSKDSCPLSFHPAKHPHQQGSTFIKSWKGRFDIEYGPPIMVACHPLSLLLRAARCPDTIDFLTIDCEGMDLEVLQSMDWGRYYVRLVCVESGSDGTDDNPMNNYLKEIGFKYHAHTRGNTFWVNTA